MKLKVDDREATKRFARRAVELLGRDELAKRLNIPTSLFDNWVREGATMPDAKLMERARTMDKLSREKNKLSECRDGSPLITRRKLLLVAFGTLAVGAASAAGPRRIGVLADTPGPHWDVFRNALAQLGYVEGKTLALEWRWAEGQFSRLPKLAADLVQLNVEVIVAEGGPAAQAAKAANPTIPIVMAISADPVGIGLVQSLTRPGGSVTGSSSRSPELYAKQLELLKEIKPALRRVAGLWHPGFKSSELATKEVVSGAAALGLQLDLIEAREQRDVAMAFTLLASKPADALLIIANPMFDGLQAQIARLATEAKLPAVYNKVIFAKEGGLLSYGARYSDFFQRAAYYVDKILNGAKPADLPVQEATAFELVINLQTARRLGMTIPQVVLLRADQVIE